MCHIPSADDVSIGSTVGAVDRIPRGLWRIPAVALSFGASIAVTGAQESGCVGVTEHIECGPLLTMKAKEFIDF